MCKPFIHKVLTWVIPRERGSYWKVSWKKTDLNKQPENVFDTSEVPNRVTRHY